VRSPLQPIGKLKSLQSRPSSADSKVHAATAMSFPTNAGLLFLKYEISKDSFLVDTGTTLSIVPPIRPNPQWSKWQTNLSNDNLSIIPFCKPPWQAPSWALTF
jgi:hypothetical protein